MKFSTFGELRQLELNDFSFLDGCYIKFTEDFEWEFIDNIFSRYDYDVDEYGQMETMPACISDKKKMAALINSGVAYISTVDPMNTAIVIKSNTIGIISVDPHNNKVFNIIINSGSVYETSIYIDYWYAECVIAKTADMLEHTGAVIEEIEVPF